MVMVRKLLDGGVDWAAAVILAAMTVLVFMQVLFRYWLHLPLDWGEEVSRYLFIWGAMLGAAIAVRRRAHFGIDLLVKTLPLSVRRPLALAVSLCVCGLQGIVIIQGAKLTLINMSQVSPTLFIPMGVPYAAIPISGFFMLLSVIAEMRTVFSGAGNQEEG
jgi:TRAP-type C4-dicarboxylate transport system permease small subunit